MTNSLFNCTFEARQSSAGFVSFKKIIKASSVNSAMQIVKEAFPHSKNLAITKLSAKNAFNAATPVTHRCFKV